ncbi:MBL fold metallo-hydrolase [Chitinophaga rhizophila]|uniref:RNAse Z n=1 Tax=Chitinophaga rhizophila TaxID=2866212 RepID=A0ABS7GED9_9BACT|nr:MBL fold metallo-hydrolase [Chitinophaga rhizophila]MBW8685650.1 RNAse Z [Chitinophaga rhizophila]
MELTITGYSTALFSTWYFVEELGLLLDAGDGMMSALLQKSRKINHVFISHADRDHLTGLLQFNQLNARDGYPVMHYPKDSRSFPFMQDFFARFDPYAIGAVWQPVTAGDEIRIKDDILVIPVRNEHVPVPTEITRSLGFKVYQTKRKLRPELTGLSGEEIRKIGLEKGKEATTMEVRANILSYSGDTPVDDLHKWEDTEILIHEATFLEREEDIKVYAHKNKHSRLDEVMEMVSGSNIKTLILGHFSSRYNASQINTAIIELCNRYAINIPVYSVLPGETVVNILKSKPVNYS